MGGPSDGDDRLSARLNLKINFTLSALALDNHHRLDWLDKRGVGQRDDYRYRVSTACVELISRRYVTYWTV